MNNIICVVRDQQFKDKAKQLNLSEDALESIVHKFKNDLQNPEAFPSDSYIRAQFAVSNIVNPKDYDNLKAIWDAEFSQPITVDSLAEAVNFRDEAAKYFKPEAITVKPQSDYTFKIIIAAPQKPTANVSQVGKKKPIVYNEEQEAAIEAAVKHINAVRSGRSKQKFFTIQGKAGTGKTTIVNEILNRLKFQGYVTPTVIMGALAHKATTVLKEKISPEVKQKYRFENRTIAGMLGMRENDRTGEFEPVKGQRPPIQSASIVIVDEASMVNEEQLALILEATKNRSIPVIFLGDIGQLPPIRTTSFYKKKNINPNEISPIFTDSSIPKSMLSVRVRQGEDSPVLEYADNYWNYSQGKRETYPNDLHSKSKVTDKGALIIQRKEVDLVKQLLPLFREAKRTGNPNLVKIVTYTTNSSRGKESAVDRYNRLIREALYPGSKTDTFEEGDLIIFNDTYGDEDGSIPNSTEASVIKVRPCDSALPKIEGVELEEVERAYITIRTKDGQQVEVPAIVPTKENRARHNRNINKLRKHRSDVYNKGGNYGEAKYAYEHYKNKYAANIGYAYAISSHKSQGSTYDVVAVDAVDINGVRAEEVSLKTKARSIYTGLTRASNITIVSSNTTNEGTIYTDIKGINDRINSVKNGTATNETFVPETEEDYFSEVTEDDLDDLIHDPETKKKTLRKRGNMEDVKVNASDERARIEKLKESDDDEVNLEKDDWDDDLDDDEDEDNSEEDEEEGTSAQDRTYADFVAKQKQLNSIIKFNRKTHTYFINGKQTDFSVTQFRDFIFGKGKRKENDFLRIASRLGNTHDSFLRDYFAGEIKDSYPNLNKEQVKKLRIQAAKLETKLREQLGEDVIFVTDEDLLKVASTVTYDGKSYTVAGTLDMVAIDSKGNIYIVDFKTHRANLNEGLSDDDKEGYAFQVTLYNAMVASNPLFKNKLRSNYIAQFNIKYADPRQNEYSFDDEQVFISINGEDIELQDAQKDGKVPYKAGVFSNLISLNADIEDMDIEVSPIKTSIQKREESKKVGEKTAVEPKRYSAQMVKFYGKKKRDGIKAVSTFGAILEGKRTATTRWNNLDFWKKVKVGDIITFKNSEGKEVNVRVTVAPHKLTKDTDPEEWSKKEGWSVEKFNEDILPHIKKGDAYQLEYEVIKDKPSSIEINSKSGKYAVLSNFGDKEFTIDGKTFPTVEHYFQWAKAIHCKDYAIANRIKKATSAKQAKYLGSHELNMSKEQQKSWDKFSRNVMKKGMKEALEQNEDAKDLLLSTGTALLTHYLGGYFADVLMELREEFGGAGKPEDAKEIEKKVKEEAKKRKEVPEAPSKKEKSTTPKEWVRRGEKQLKVSTEGYRKGDPQDNPDVAYVFTENAQAATQLYDFSEGQKKLYDKYGYDYFPGTAKLNVSDVKGTNQAGIRTDSKGNRSENAFGIVVKKQQQDKNGNWLAKEGQFEDTDEDFEMFKDYNERFFNELANSGLKKIIFPSQMALGKAALPKRFAEWLANELNNRYGIQSTILKNETTGYEGYGLSIDSIKEKKVDSNLHIEKISDRYTAKESSESDVLNEKASALRKQGWHVEFYSKKAKDGSHSNEVMTISIDGNPKKGFFELEIDSLEEGGFSCAVHFKTKSKKAMNESEFAEEALEDSEKEDLFKALIFAIPEGGTVSTWGTLTKGGISALDSLAKRSNGSLSKIGDKTVKNTEGNDIMIPVYAKLTEDEIIANNLAKIRKTTAIQKKHELPNFSGEFYGIKQYTGDTGIYTGIFNITLQGSTGIDSIDITDGSKNDELASLIKALPYSSIVSLNRSNVNANFLYTLDEMLKNPTLYAVWGSDSISIDPNSAEGMIAKEYARTNKKFQYNSKTGELKLPKFTVGKSYDKIQRIASYNKLINNDVLTQEELRKLSKATMYKLSEFITMIQSYKNGYRKLFGEDTDKDFTQMSRIQIINEIGIKNLLLKVRERVFDSEVASDNISEATRDKMDVVFENWDAFVELGYDTLIGLEEIALDGGDRIKNDLNDNTDEEDESVVQELFGSSIEHWQVGFRQVSAFNSLSKMIKRTMDSLYVLDENGNQKFNEFGIADHLDAQEAVSKILNFTQGAQSLDAKDASGNLLPNSMISMLKERLNAEPWLQQVIDLLEDKYDEESNLIKKADEQFKAQFYSNFKKYFQKYTITYKKRTKTKEGFKDEILVKVINESPYSEVLLNESRARENSFAIGGFKLKNKDGSINLEALKKLKELSAKLSDFREKVDGTKGKVSELVDLNEYHSTIKDVIDLLGMSSPESETLNNLFAVKTNLKEFSKRLEYLVDKIENIKKSESITGFREYKQMLDVLAKQMGLEMESVSYESGKMYYSYVLPSYLGRLVTKLKSENMSDEEYKEFLQNEYLSYKWFAKDVKGRTKIRCRWLDRLSRSKEARDNFTHVTSLHYLGTDYTAKTPVEYIASMMKMFFFDNNKKWAYFRVPMLSNKPSEEYIKFERITGNYQDLITGYMWDVFTQELDRIQAVRQRQKTIDDDQKIVSKGKKGTFDKRGLEFVFEDYLQKYLDGSYINDFDTSTVQYGSEEEVEQLLKEKEQADRFHDLLNKKLDGTISEESTENAELMELFKVFTKKGFEENYQAAKQQWIDEGFIQVDAEGKITKVFNNMKLSEDDLKEFFWNDAFAATQILELTITDMAFAVDTEDLQKRLAQLHAPGTQANILAKDSKGNLYTKDGIERTIYIKDDMVKSSMLANLKMAKEQIILDTPKERRAHVAAQLDGVISSFEKINFADAQGYSCPSSYRKKMGIFGNWDARMEDAYEKVIHPEQYPDVNLSDMLDVLWQPLKPFVYTQLRKPGYNDILPEIKVPVQNKNSEYVLVMADAILRYAGMPNKLQAIYDFMEESQHNADGTLNGQGIDTIQFMSAVNMGCSGVIDLNDTVDKNGEVTYYKTEEEIKEELGKAYEWDEEGNRVYSQDYVHEIPFEDYIIQQNVPSHFMKHEQAHGSQDRILTFADMLDVDPYTGEINYLIIDGKKVSVAEAKKNYFKAIADNINDSVQELVRRFNLENKDQRARNEAISEVLQDTILKDSRYGSDLLWACSTNEYGEFNIPLSDPIQSNRIQQLLNSIIKNTINKQEIAGGPLVQVSSWGLSTSLNIRFKDSDGNLLLTEKEFNNLKDPFPNESITPRGYREQTKDSFWKWKSVDGYDTYEEYIEDQAGVAYFESLVPIPDENFAKDFMKKDANGNEYIDVAEIEKVNPDMLNMIGYRIPTENKYSMIPIKVVGFLPRTGGEGIMLPADITNLAGSDFDIDKDYIMKMVFNRVEKNGKVIYEKPTKGRAARNNLIIATQLAVLQSEQVQKQLFTPGNFEEPKKFGYRISYIQNEARRTGVSPEKLWQATDNWDNDQLKDANKATKNLIFNNVQVQFHKQNMTAGKLIGIFAQANVSHAFISLNDEASLMIPSEYSFSLNGIKVEGNFAIDSVLTKDKSTNISSNLASLLAASVDAVKDPILNLMNININTANMVTAMIRMGFSLQTVSLLASQPIIVDLIRDYAIQKANSYVDIGELISSYKENMPEDVKQIEDIKVTDQDLIANLTGEEPTTNYMVLEIFDRMRTIADTFGDITHMTRYNSVISAVGPFASDSMTQRTKDKAFNDNAMIGTAIKEACNNPILSAFRDGSNYIERQLLGRNLIQAESKFESLLEKLGKKLGFSRGVPAKYANAFSDFYMSFYVNAGQESVFDLSYDNRKYVLTQFPKEFLRLKSKYKDNLLINSIQYVESDREEFGFLQLKTRGLNSTVMEDLKQAWVSLYEDENTRDLAINLVQYNFFRGSFGFSPKTFMSLTPNTVKSNLNGYIEVLNSKDSRVKTMDMDNRIINQFILHNQKLIIDRFTGLENYNPVEIYDDVYGEVIQLDRKPKEPEENKGKKKKKTSKTLKASRPIIKIDNDFYFVIPKEDSSILVVKKVDALGGDGQGFEISVDEDFPKSIYSSDFKSTRKDSSEDEGGSFKKDNISEEAAEVLLDQLFEDDDTLEDVVGMPASKAIDEINKELSSRSIHKKVLNKGKNVKTIMKLLDKLEGISNPRELLNKSERTLSDEGFCN